MDLKGVELFKTGRWNDVKTFVRDDLEAMADSFAALRLGGRVPLKFGHNEDQPITDGQPALGWVDRVYVEGDVLKGDFTDLPRSVYDAIKAGRYKFVSVELLRDVAAGDREYPWVLSAVALLGADIPAVAGLRDLQALTHSRRAGFPTGTRMTFTINGGQEPMTDEAKKLRDENAKLQRQLVAQAQDFAIVTGRCRPAERERFNRRHGEGGTLTEWNEWLRDVQRPQNFNRDERRGGNDSRAEHKDTMRDEDGPDSELVALAQAEVEKSGGKLNYFAAQRKVLRSNPDLAQRYRLQPGTTEG